eukprot:COSAG06_NODE_56296_length_285_cov_1.096774_1_plen_72_part_10
MEVWVLLSMFATMVCCRCGLKQHILRFAATTDCPTVCFAHRSNVSNSVIFTQITCKLLSLEVLEVNEHCATN